MNSETTEQFEEVESLHRAISERYLQYALSTIMHRALPDARDGLKPVHRRILFAMRELKLTPTSGFRKSAKIAGDVMGNYHPHGDQAIYDSLVRLAQDFNMRYPLVQGQGNFGNIDGDGAAASRYTEARLAEAAEGLLRGLDQDAVDFRPNYDGTLTEPVVLPAEYPNLLANGASGIAVGMATNIPPHNIGELCDACLHLLKVPDARDDTLTNFVLGPDFPTGGIIVEPKEKLRKVYRSGRGAIRLRARWHTEHLERGAWQIVVTEIPYRVQKSRLVERIADLIQSKKLQALADVRDESAEDVRLVLEPRSRAIEPAAMMAALFQQSDLEVRFSMNLNALIDGKTPKVCSLKEVLTAFLGHRRIVLERRSRHRLQQIERRVETLEGCITVFLNLDRVIQIIRTEERPKLILIDEFELTDLQAESILNMRLRSLRKLEELELRKEHDVLLEEQAQLKDLLEDPELQRRELADEIKSAKKRYGKSADGGARRTDFDNIEEVEELPEELFAGKEPITVLCSKAGWIRAVKGAVNLEQAFRYRDGDEERFVFHAETTDRLLLMGSNGRFYTVAASNLPGGRGLGEPIRLMVDLPNDCEIVNLSVYRDGRKLLLASAAGYGFLVEERDALASKRGGKQVMNVRSPDVAKFCVAADGDHAAFFGDSGNLLILPLSDLPTLGRGRGNKIQSYQKGGLASVKVFCLQNGLQWKDRGNRQRTVKDLEHWLGKRGQAGKKPPHGFPRNGSRE